MLIIISARLLPKRGIFPRETPEVLIKLAVFSSCTQVRARIHAVVGVGVAGLDLCGSSCDYSVGGVTTWKGSPSFKYIL